ncbi:MAG: tetratricopeptide repeat protein [Humidesulfovibrio sp.]|uniref:tetratricopeptide repeat protein n=1 Tax=Humidesulfovibrio sp. TaxID=2910988 RepID=UPI0027FFF09E|nr:tetratricopeptide repeat protein [Humidesulfovibrio sp.]MDQ7834736.1 tetratricopeptide repeat protein [Humidesulfovibrio sp.]
MDSKHNRPPIRGIFSQTKTTVIGSGATARKMETVLYFFARENEDGIIDVQHLGEEVVFGPVERVSLDEFLKTYQSEPELSLRRAREDADRQRDVLHAVARGDKFLKNGKTFSAEFEYGKALSLDEECVRATFGIGQCYILRGEQDKARAVLERLLRLEAAFEAQHKHLFNEFGISLRRSGMHAEALAYYGRAVELCPNDENLHYNMARASHAMGDTEVASLRLAYCLTLNPDHAEAKQFQDFLKRKKPAGG